MHRVHFILGCTASGKGAVGRELARRLGGRILSVDSMKVYRRMDIGTAKPGQAVRAEIPHYAIDVVEPAEGYSVAQYVEEGDRAIEEIASARDVALAVGGTSLYVKALAEGLFDGPGAHFAYRAELDARAEADGLASLHAELAEVDGEAADRIHPNDRKRIFRALEVHHATGRPISELQRQWESGPSRYDCTFIGLRRDRADQNARINRRARKMLDAGLRDEVAALLAEADPLSPQAAQAVGYAEMIDHLRGRCTLDEAFERIKINTRRLAKKQRTWQRRFTDVRWFDLAPEETAPETAERILQAIDFRPA